MNQHASRLVNFIKDGLLNYSSWRGKGKWLRVLCRYWFFWAYNLKWKSWLSLVLHTYPFLVGKSFFWHENCFKRICLLKLGWWAYQRVLQETWNHVNLWNKREAQQSWYIGKVPVSLNKGVHRYQEMHGPFNTGKMQVMGEIGRGTFLENQKICFNTQCQR